MKRRGEAAGAGILGLLALIVLVVIAVNTCMVIGMFSLAGTDNSPLVVDVRKKEDKEEQRPDIVIRIQTESAARAVSD